ncbi:MAG: aminoacyl-tRNA hydrolase [Candidatus Binatus sp.]|jgi:PTH1 family peptidyl-tRNA hydrolase|uniref:aminoacyl-tRNA hydrolase n=1 Tax=Candidatus Binatus sp. TaxID=2811406 RepID=UPI003C729ED3
MAAIKRLFGNFRSSRAKKSDSEARSAIEWVVTGLGNPGEEYARSRHNSGFMTIDRIAKAKGVELGRRRFKGVTAETTLAEKPALLVKPQTFYNLSGECVSALLGYFKIPPNHLIVLHDELDLEAGRLRIKQGGGDAGNRGVRSIAESLGTTDFIRVRIGIGRPPGFTVEMEPGRQPKTEENKDYLLRPMTAAERDALAPILERAASAVEAIAANGLEAAMNRYNQRS